MKSVLSGNAISLGIPNGIWVSNKSVFSLEMDWYKISYKRTVSGVTVLYHGYEMYVVDIHSFISSKPICDGDGVVRRV